MHGAAMPRQRIALRPRTVVTEVGLFVVGLLYLRTNGVISIKEQALVILLRQAMLRSAKWHPINPPMLSGETEPRRPPAPRHRFGEPGQFNSTRKIPSSSFEVKLSLS